MTYHGAGCDPTCQCQQRRSCGCYLWDQDCPNYTPIKEKQLNKMQQQVLEFHRGMGQPVGYYAQPLPAHRIPVRVELIREEFIDELIPALESGDLVETVDAAIDILYVVFGLLVEMGVNAQPLFDEVQASNMSKFGADGKPIIAGPNDPDGIFEGRVKKGPNYFKPKLRQILENGTADQYLEKVVY